ncbi:hypothetical protein JAAARDRAFT_36212 [Jaapia argillacea MUCL 33604]|uniref:BRO domain-containing protein 1 n=1 Tax=Jaapia argillacea MUCL 33604 TaxID=933084 RepID=A0A067PPJ2_9AGAM|nr:hypothetical protein JAAARDRAFT_36212 [Jaapia argillacea MUCL 33604]
MAHQAPMISIPKKATEEVDWTTPIRNQIAQSYGESPDSYATECATLQRCRQDAVRGAGSDLTARDLLYKYFGQLELLELRFSEIRVNFPWRDAFTQKLITQTSIAYEKASIIFQIASTHSSIASNQNRSDPEGLKRAFHYFRTCAGMLTYINDNFLHAPSTDLGREVIKFLVGIIMAQATEVFFEKITDEKKGNALVARVAAQAAYLYNSLSEEVKEFMGKGIFDRNWVTIIQIKSKYFTSMAQYYKGLADHAAGKHGDSLVRFTLAETAAKEAQRTASTFDSIFVTQMSPTLPPDAGPTIRDLTKAHLALCTDRKAEAQRDNDLIYNAVLPSPDTLPVIEKAVVATAISIQDVYGAPDVQKVIGTDIFIRLIPLSVHESASVYSEEKAKLVRGEVEKAESAEVEVKSALEALGVKEGLNRFKSIAEGGVEEEVPLEVRRWREDIQVMEEREPAESLIGDLNRLKEGVRNELESISRDLEIESKDCEAMRIKYDHLWTQAPSAALTKTLRQDLKSHYGALEAASASDQQVSALWDAVKGDIGLLLSPQVEDVFRESTQAGVGGGGENLLDIDIGSEAKDVEEKNKIGNYVEEIDERLGRLNKISHERGEVLRDLKEKIQSDDVSHLLLLNRRNSAVEPTLFAAELEKFRPYQQRLAATVHHQQLTLQEITTLWKSLKDLAGRGPGAKKWDEREKRKKDTVRRFSRARDGYMEVRDGVAKGLQFYHDLTELSGVLKRNVKDFVSSRTAERETIASSAETQRRLTLPAPSSGPPPLADKPPRPPPPPAPSLDSSFSAMNIGGSGPASPPLPPTNRWNGVTSPAAPQSYSSPQPPRPPSQYQPQPQSQYQPQQPSQFQSQPSYQSQSPAQYRPQPPPVPSQATGSSTFLPPPPPRPSQPSYSTPSAPPQDPYAGLNLFSAQFSSASNQAPTSSYASQPQQQQPSYSSPPPPPPPPSQYGYSQQQPQHQRQPSYPPPPPSQPSYQYQQPSSPFPPPPQQYQQYGGAQQVQQQTPFQGFPPPPSQQPYNQYSQSYGR